MNDFNVSTKTQNFFCVEQKPESSGIVIFGASGDLSFRKLIPSIFNLYKKDLLNDFYIIGFSRSKFTDKEYKEKVFDALKNRAKNSEIDKLQNFIEKCHYQSGSYDNAVDYDKLKKRIYDLDSKFQVKKNHIIYLSTPPTLYMLIAENLAIANLSRDNKDKNFNLIIEKPFGRDLESAKKLNRAIKTYFNEENIFRIDHYLGKETVQNILIFRFANAVFEPIWNRQYIDSVQITVSESLGIGHRAGYFESAGLLRDMFQNHILQLLSLVTMEPPISFDSERIRDEKVKLLRSIKKFDKKSIKDNIVKAQYTEGEFDNRRVVSYVNEKNVNKDSKTETYVAAKFFIDNWRWKDVPFYIRSGKRLKSKLSEISIKFKKVPHCMFSNSLPCEPTENVLVFNVQPNEGISLTIQAKNPGPKLCMNTLNMDFSYKDRFNVEPPDAYERLFLDCMLNDQTLFIRDDDLELSWKLIDPILKEWEDDKVDEYKLYKYRAGSQGPKEAEDLIKNDNREFRDI